MKNRSYFTHYYKGMYINGRCDKPECYITDETCHFKTRTFKSYRSAQINITKARNKGIPASR